MQMHEMKNITITITLFIRWSVCWLVGLLVGPSVPILLMLKLLHPRRACAWFWSPLFNIVPLIMEFTCVRVQHTSDFLHVEK
jgi:hypothetical protein